MAGSDRPRDDGQQRLALERSEPQDRDSFICSASNLAARVALESPDRWPGAVLALVGPEGCGKTHLARVWAQAEDAEIVGDPALAPPGRPVAVEDVDRVAQGESLFHLLERGDPAAPVLLTARSPPLAWATSLPDLRSRLGALMVAELQSPDDPVLEALLARFFRERSIRPHGSVIEYLVRRIERSAPAAREVVARIDEAAAAGRRGVTRELAREVVGEAEREDEADG